MADKTVEADSSSTPLPPPVLPPKLIVPTTQRHHRTYETFSPIRIHFAINKNDIDRLKQLVSKSSSTDLNFVARGNTPLTLALLNEYFDMAELLVDCIVPSDLLVAEQTRWQRQPIHLAVKSGSLGLVKRIVSRCPRAIHSTDAMLFTPLHWAAVYRRVGVLEYLLDQDAHVNVRDDLGRTPLHRATESDDVELMARLVSAGALIEIRDDFGWTVLFQAVVCGMVTSVEYLLNHGSNANTADNTAQTVLHAACDRATARYLIILTKYSADYYTRHLRTAGPLLHSAVSRDAYTDLHQVHLLLDHGARVNAVDSQGRTPLRAAAESGRGDVIRCLYAAGSNLSLDSQWITAGQWPNAMVDDSVLCEWLTKASEVKVRPLMELCKFAVRASLGSLVEEKIEMLPLPGRLRQFCSQLHIA